jgi:plasmid stabilization system protein ParE
VNRRLVVEPEADEELSEAADWYERRNPAACAAFVRAIDRALRLIEEYPEQYQVVYRQRDARWWMDFLTRSSIRSQTAKSS